MTKQCRCCKENKPFSEFQKSKINKDGLYSYCYDCKSIKRKQSYLKNKDKAALYYKDNIEVIKQKKKDHYNKNRERIIQTNSEYRKMNWKVYQANYYKYYEKNRDRLKEKCRNYAKNNLIKFRISNVKRHSDKLKRTPPWADLKAIQEFYNKCPEGYEVDHIIPLRGKNVSGFHILENLQYLTKQDNLRKSNKFGELNG